MQSSSLHPRDVQEIRDLHSVDNYSQYDSLSSELVLIDRIY
jgi:hypothetical protein